MFDVFYFGEKPNLYAFEKHAVDFDDAAAQCRTGFFWFIYGGNDYSNFDFGFRPVPWESEHTHVWGSQWQRDGGVYLGHVDYYHNKTWHFRKEQVIKRLPDKTNWNLPEELNESTIDFSWHPNPMDPPYIYHFGTDYQESIGLTYTVPTATEIKFAGPVPSDGYHKISVMEVLDIFFIDRGNPTAQVRFERLSERYNVTKVRYANSMMDTIKRCVNRSKTTKFWVISSEYDYDSFDFRWHASPWQMYMTHVFPSQHNKWSDTFLIHKHEFERQAVWAKSLEEFSNLNFVTDQSVNKTEVLANIYYVDHGNPESEIQYEAMKLQHPDLIKTRFANDYLSTMKRIIGNADTEYVWIINSICDYSLFDFTWKPEPWQSEMIHCFSNNFGNWNEKRGDTFYIHVKSFKKQMVELQLLDWFNVINYVTDLEVNRYEIPVVNYEFDLIKAIHDYDFKTPYAMFANRDFGESELVVDCVWTEKDRTARPMSTGGGLSVIPRDIKKYLKTQIYDYPYLWKYEEGMPFNYYMDQCLDIVYISNGEPDADKWFDHLLLNVLNQKQVVADFPKFTNKLHRVSNVNGRVAAYQAAARASTTPWFFAVFAKLEVDMDFNFNWQPDMWQGLKHYIFNSKNPVNGLEYGHMGVIAYNKQLVLENNNPGIDFTLSQPHESVPVLSGTAHFNQDMWTTWRTAFREVLKLMLFNDTQPTIETEHRLNVWQNVAYGDFSEYSKMGARDAVEYYNEVNGDPEKLQLSFEWDWLRNRFNDKT